MKTFLRLCLKRQPCSSSLKSVSPRTNSLVTSFGIRALMTAAIVKPDTTTNCRHNGVFDCNGFIPKRKFSSVEPDVENSVNSLALSVPSNLQLADKNILQKDIEEMEEEMIPIERYLFPKMHKDTRKELPIHRFRAPGEFSDRTAKLDPNVFSVALRKDVVLEMVRYQRNKIRQPQMTKRRKHIAGSNKKPWAQKGLGRAQFGHKRNSVWRKGQKAHGPVLRNFNIYTNRKQRAMALMITLAAKLEEDNIIVFDEFAVEDIKTKNVFSLLTQHGLHKFRCLIVDDNVTSEFEKSVANLPLHTVMEQKKTNVYDLMKRDKLVITAKALEDIQRRVMAQYLHRGKMKAYLRNIEPYLVASQEIADSRNAAASTEA